MIKVLTSQTNPYILTEENLAHWRYESLDIGATKDMPLWLCVYVINAS